MDGETSKQKTAKNTSCNLNTVTRGIYEKNTVPHSPLLHHPAVLAVQTVVQWNNASLWVADEAKQLHWSMPVEHSSLAFACQDHGRYLL